MQLIAKYAQVEEIGEEQKKKKRWRFDVIKICPFLYGFLLICASRILFMLFYWFDCMMLL